MSSDAEKIAAKVAGKVRVALWLRVLLGAESFWLFSIAGLGMVAVGAIAVAIIIRGSVPEGAGEILATIATGILLTSRDVIGAIRAKWKVALEDPPAPIAPCALNQRDPANPPVDRGENG